MSRWFSFAECDCVAFDLDHTAVRYHVENLEELVFRCVVRYLVEHKQYPSSTSSFTYPKDFAFKGMVIDRHAGNLLKVSAERLVIAAYHGTKRRLTRTEIEELYPGGALPHPFTGATTEHYIPMNTYFDRPLGPIFALLVDALDAAHADQKDAPAVGAAEYATVANDLLTSLYFNFAVYESGYFFPEMRDNIERYVFKRPKVAKWFNQLRSEGVKVLLVTNSLPPFTRLLCECAFGNDWQELFDLVIFQARKPQFWLTPSDPSALPTFNEVQFLSDAEMHSLRSESSSWRSDGLHGPQSSRFAFKRVATAVNRLQSGKLYENGHVGVLTSFLEELCGKAAPDLTLCYVGDHLISDVAVTKATVQWKTIAVVEELEHVEPGLYTVESDGSHLSLPHSPVWGSFFSDEIDGRRVDTAAMRILQDYADLCCACLSDFVENDVKTRYESAPEHPLGMCALLQREIPSYSLYYFTNPLASRE